MRAQQRNASTAAWLCLDESFQDLCISGYTPLAHNPDVMIAVNKIATLVSSMTIHLMSNTTKGDVRIKNELSRHIDISPNKYMTRQALIYTIVRTMLLDGNGNSVVYPKTDGGFLGDLIPIPPSRVSFAPTPDFGYRIYISGTEHDPANILHFTVNPDPENPWRGQGYRVILKDVASNLKQARATEKGFLESKWKPSVIVKVDALTDEFSSPEGRSRLLNSYISTSKVGEPWMIPAEQFDVKEIRPLSLNDLAIADVMTIDKKTVAAILGVPPFLLGAGSYSKDEWNNFINSTIMPIARGIEQELTRKLLISPDWYFRFNSRSLYSYDIKDLAAVGDDQFVRGIMDGNEVRDWIGLAPRDGLNELVILENYIPRGMIADQNKLTPKENEK